MKVIIFGATGMVGEGVLHIALSHPDVESVLVIGRRTCSVNHSKLTELIHSDFFEFSGVAHVMSGYDACFYCMGTSSVGMKEDDYRKVTYDITLSAARTLADVNPAMVFCYVSGEGTDSTEQGRLMWARVKGKTENDLGKLPFRSTYNFRPGFIRPMRGMRNTITLAKPLVFLYPIFKALMPAHGCTLEELGGAMINVTRRPYTRRILENTDIALAAADAY